MATIKQIHLNKTEKVSDKWESYLNTYDKLFEEFKYQPINLFEIGIQNGGSLETWAEYFKNAKTIIGCDIEPMCNLLKFSDDRIKLVVNDIKSPATYKIINSWVDSLDIVIDDGSHNSIDILEAFGKYFPMMNPGGVYVIEDTHTLYWKDWGEGSQNKFNAYTFFKKMIDVINIQFWEKEMSIEQYMSDFFESGAIPSFVVDGSIESIEFRNSLIIVRKSNTEILNSLGKRIVTGTQDLVNYNVKEHNQK
jgi:hypothetical protein